MTFEEWWNIDHLEQGYDKELARNAWNAGIDEARRITNDYIYRRSDKSSLFMNLHGELKDRISV